MIHTSILMDVWCLEAPYGYWASMGIAKMQLRCMPVGHDLRGSLSLRTGAMRRRETRPRASAHHLALSVQSFWPGDRFARAHSGAWTLPAKRTSQASKDANFGLIAAEPRANYE